MFRNARDPHLLGKSSPSRSGRKGNAEVGSMLNILEQPWTMLVIGFWAELAVIIGAKFWPLKLRRKHLLIGPIIIVLGFGLEYLVVTDREKIQTVVDTIVQATEEGNAEQIIECIAPDYHGRLEGSREAFAQFCRRLFGQPLIENNLRQNLQLQLDKTEATVRITAWSQLDKRSQWAMVPLIKTVWEVRLSKQPDKTWLVVWIDLLELNDERMNRMLPELQRALGVKVRSSE